MSHRLFETCTYVFGNVSVCVCAGEHAGGFLVYAWLGTAIPAACLRNERQGCVCVYVCVCVRTYARMHTLQMHGSVTWTHSTYDDPLSIRYTRKSGLAKCGAPYSYLECDEASTACRGFLEFDGAEAFTESRIETSSIQ
jgi:hypothetical protein